MFYSVNVSILAVLIVASCINLINVVLYHYHHIINDAIHQPLLAVLGPQLSFSHGVMEEHDSNLCMIYSLFTIPPTLLGIYKMNWLR